MNLELASGRSIENVTEEDIRSLLEGEAYAILSVDNLTYLQTAEEHKPPYEYALEYQDGSTSQHYKARDRPMTLGRVVDAFVQYLRGDESWRTDFRWKRIKID